MVSALNVATVMVISTGDKVALYRSWQWGGINALPYSRAPELVVLMRCGMIASGWSAVGPWRCRLRLQRGQ